MEDLVTDRTRAAVLKNIDAALNLPAVDEPLLGPDYGWLHRVTSSLLRRDGTLIQDVLAEILVDIPGLVVMRDQEVAVSSSADQLAGDRNLAACLETELPYNADRARVVCPDIVVFFRRTGHLEFLEVKRGMSKLGAGTLRSLTRDLLCMQMLGRAWGRANNFNVQSVRTYGISIYGMSGLAPDLTIYGEELDDHFSYPVIERANAALGFAKREVTSRLPTIVDETGAGWPLSSNGQT